jgi:diguanylate cyclase (GGDEF)-like protein
MDEVIKVTLAELVDLSAQAGDVYVGVDQDGIVMECSDPAVRVNRAIADVFASEDGSTVADMLSEGPAGPAWARLRVKDELAWVSLVATPRADGGWLLLARIARQLDPTASVAGGKSERMANREQALDEVAWLLSATPRTGKEIAVASCDLDDLDFVNEEYGRDVGDEVLRIITGRISDTLRSGDLVARLEDDQLLVVLRGVHHLRGAIRVANKIRVAVEDPIPMPFGEIVQTVSIGVTLISRGESVDSVLERAEGAMAMAKQAGRNRVMSSPPI